MYFAILGRHPKLSLAEFALVPTTTLRRQAQIVLFETELDESSLLTLLAKLWGIVKWGSVVEEKSREVERKWEEIEGSEEVKQFLTWVTLVWMNDQKLGMELKKIYGIKRFKIVEQISTDLEVKKEWKELMDLGGDKIGLVLGWQDIAHFEQVDFWKPASGMEVGMMPSKLAQILVNIGVQTLESRFQTSDSKIKTQNSWVNEQKTIYDPFCGFGTTGFVANRVGHHFVWSDLVITWAKENAKRWKDTALAMTEELHFTVFKHDVTEPFDHPLVKKIDVIVTEGWLWPVISRKTRESELLVHAEKIKALYFTFLNNISAVIPQVPMVLTIPHYSRLPDAILPEIVTHAVTLWYHIEDLGVYSRKWQEVCRQVVVLSRS